MPTDRNEFERRSAPITNMSGDQLQDDSDEWSEWLLSHRHGSDPALEKSVRACVDGYADRVLDGARLTPGSTLADIGTGTGQVAFRAIDRIGKSLRVLLTDISGPLIRHAQFTARQRNVLDQCNFIQAPADDLREIPDASVDAVTTRAVLTYVHDKCAALREFHRILKPGGRVSVAEPILQDDAFDTIALKRMVDTRRFPLEHEVLSLLHRWRAAQFPDTLEQLAQSPMANYSERDLLGYFREVGFVEIHLERISTWGRQTECRGKRFSRFRRIHGHRRSAPSFESSSP